MTVTGKIQELREALAHERQAGKRIGFVPTMGALHDGHLSLTERCRMENDVCAVSIFVNPTQFNDRRDLAAYPRTLEKDCGLLSAAGCDYVFAPSEEEMYPEPDTRVFDLGTVASGMEGAFRPGHFNGVAQVVSKLFRAVEPDSAYFGEKDFQQVAVVREMTKRLGLPVQIVACPILREPDGLAMSSRNVRLTAGERRIAPLIAATLKESRTFAAGKSVREVIDRVVNTLNQSPPLRVEYFEIVDGMTLLPVRQWNGPAEPVGCIAVYCGEVRLIDNVKYERGAMYERNCNLT
ncbi:MAG: pantoate--beta-alanine ligase [Tannerella sp.]|jgi:pantoate--beta-alanine ligase|nr:pantoate--beta-alanine ligase [Tannerella sp.]